MPGLKKKSMDKKESSSSSYKDTMMKLKNYWPESTINLYLTKAITLHDLDSYIVTDEQMADINKVVLNIDDWYKKNPEYSFMTATKLLKEKAQIHMELPSNRDTDNGSAISRYFRSEYRSRSRYERAVEEDQYSRRSPGFDEDMSDDNFLDQVLHTEPSMPPASGHAILRGDSLDVAPVRPRSTTSAGPAETVMAAPTPVQHEVLYGTTPDGTMIPLQPTIINNVYSGTDDQDTGWSYNTETGVWQRQ